MVSDWLWRVAIDVDGPPKGQGSAKKSGRPISQVSGQRGSSFVLLLFYGSSLPGLSGWLLSSDWEKTPWQGAQSFMTLMLL